MLLKTVTLFLIFIAFLGFVAGPRMRRTILKFLGVTRRDR